jgi:hypothetical protein
MYFAFDGNTGDVLSCIVNGVMDDDATYAQALASLGRAGATLVAFMRHAVEQKYDSATASR